MEKNEIDNDEFEYARNLSVQAISQSQNFIREKNEISSVSLREVRRFNIFFDFFYEYLNSKNQYDNENDDVRSSFINLSKKDFLTEVINLSIFICYYMRISDKQIRNEYINIMEKLFKQSFLEIPNREEEYIASNVKIGPGIAKNKALLDNLFTLFVCINTQIPVFICGKPGCSKSLSVQLIYKSMKGENSESQFFKHYPKIIMNSYQGSKTSTSKGVLSIFQKAHNIIKNIKEKKKKIDIKELIIMKII